MKYKIVMTAVLYLISLSVRANIDKNCMAHAVSNLDMKRCSNMAYEYADKELNTIYNQFINECKKSQNKDSNDIVDRLKSAQEAWIKFRDANCSFIAASMLGGSGEMLVQSECLGEMTRSRTIELKKIEREILNRC